MSPALLSPNIPSSSLLDDIFDSSPIPPSPIPSQSVITTSNELDPNHLPSVSGSSQNPDLKHLRNIHVTNGYRDGITSSKSAAVQPAFDAGFPLGAELGYRSAWIISCLEQLIKYLPLSSISTPISASATDSNNSRSLGVVQNNEIEQVNVKIEMKNERNIGNAEQGQEVLRLARKELGLSSILSQEYFDEEGRPKWIAESTEDERNERRGAEHPVIVSWQDKVRDIAESVGLELDMFTTRDVWFQERQKENNH